MSWISFFKRKKQKQPEKNICIHKYKDFSWYLNCYEESDAYYTYQCEVIAPYVCVKCKERRNEILNSYGFRTKNEMWNCAKELEKQFPDHIKPLLIVEDEIKDMQLVDQEYLEKVDMVLHPENYYNDNFATSIFNPSAENPSYLPAPSVRKAEI